MLELGYESSLRLLSIRDAGVIAKERVVLVADDAVDLVNFLLLDSHGSGAAQIRDLNRYVFWFPQREVARGDLIRVYSRKGKNNITPGTYQNKPARYHNLFWGKQMPIWTGYADTAVLITIASWALLSKQQ